MVFLRRICSSRPGDGEQRRQSLAALTARGRGLYCFQPQPRQLVSTRSSRAPCAFPNLRCYPRCWLFSCLGVYFHLRILPESTKRSAAAISRSQRSFITFSWCASDYSIVGRISCYVSHDSTRTNVCQWLFAEIFSLTAAVSNRIDSIRNLYIFFALNFPTLENPILEKMNYRIQPSSHSSHASSSSSNQSGLSS